MYLEELIPGVCLESDNCGVQSKTEPGDVVGNLVKKHCQGLRMKYWRRILYWCVEDKTNKLIGFDKRMQIMSGIIF